MTRLSAPLLAISGMLALAVAIGVGRFAFTPILPMMPVVICYGILGFGYIIPGTFLPAMAKQVIADPAVFGWAWPIFGSAALVSTLRA